MECFNAMQLHQELQTMTGMLSLSTLCCWNHMGGQNHWLTRITVSFVMQQHNKHMPVEHGRPAGALRVAKRNTGHTMQPGRDQQACPQGTPDQKGDCWSHSAATHLTSMAAPLAPRGCPSATAPPCTFTLQQAHMASMVAASLKGPARHGSTLQQCWPAGRSLEGSATPELGWPRRGLHSRWCPLLPLRFHILIKALHSRMKVAAVG